MTDLRGGKRKVIRHGTRKIASNSSVARTSRTTISGDMSSSPKVTVEDQLDLATEEKFPGSSSKALRRSIVSKSMKDPTVDKSRSKAVAGRKRGSENLDEEVYQQKTKRKVIRSSPMPIRKRNRIGRLSPAQNEQYASGDLAGLECDIRRSPRNESPGSELVAVVVEEEGQIPTSAVNHEREVLHEAHDSLLESSKYGSRVSSGDLSDDEDVPDTGLRIITQHIPTIDSTGTGSRAPKRNNTERTRTEITKVRDIVRNDDLISSSEEQEEELRERDDSYLLTVDEVNEFEEGEQNLEASSDFDGEDDLLLKSLRAQKERRARSKATRRSAIGAASLLSSQHLPYNVEKNGLGNIREEWELEYQARPLSYFSSSEARMEQDQKLLRLMTGQERASSYTGVKVTETNNSDIEFVFNRAFKSKSRSGTQTYSNFLTCIGQLARAGIALRKLSLPNLWKPGELFKIADNSAFFELFINHFSSTSTPTTLANKAAQLIKFVNFPMSYWGIHPRYPRNAERNNAMQMKMAGVVSFLRQDRTVHKNAARRIRQRTKEDWHRSSAGKFVSEEMMDLLRGVALDALKGVITSLKAKFDEKCARDSSQQRQIFDDTVLKNWGLLLKWNVNFLALLLLFGNGQRNQVYTFLKCPTVAEMILFRTEHGGSKASAPLKIHIHEDEKRIRDSRMPFIMLDPVVFEEVNFHVRFVQPFLVRKYKIPIDSADATKLMLDTRNGHSISSDNVRKSLSTWIRAVDPELNITPMDLRSSYATIMIRRHATRGKKREGTKFAFQSLSEEEFIVMLACVMNTSPEQLRQVYAASSHSNYALHVAQVMNICRTSDSILSNCEGYDELTHE